MAVVQAQRFRHAGLLAPQHVGILIPGPGIEPSPPALEAWSLNNWTAREIPQLVLLEAEACLHSSVFRSMIFSVSSRTVKRQTEKT